MCVAKDLDMLAIYNHWTGLDCWTPSKIETLALYHAVTLELICTSS